MTEVPLAQDNEARLTKMRTQLESIFRHLHIAHDEVAVCASSAVNEGQPDLATVLSLSICNRIYGQMKLLTNVIERLGGRTEFTENREEEARIDAEIRARKSPDGEDKNVSGSEP